MNDVEQLLEETAAAYRAQVRAPERDTTVVPLALRRRPSTRWLAAAAAAAVVVAIAAGLATRDEGDPVSSGPASTVAPEVFDAEANELCREIETGLAGVDVRFETPEAYRVVAEQRLDVVRSAQRTLPPPADDPALTGRVAADINLALSQLEAARDAAARGALTEAAASLTAAQDALGRAARRLELHGAAECRAGL